jgi:hypothetical protein
MRRWVECEEAVVLDVEASAKGNLAVHHHELAMVAQVEVGLRPRDERGKEARDGDATLAQHPDDRRMAVAGAHAVDQHPHDHAPPHGPGQRGDEPVSHLPPVEDIGGQRDAVRRLINRLEHRGIGGVAVDERFHEIPGDERRSGRCTDERSQGTSRRWHAVGEPGLLAQEDDRARRSRPREGPAPAHAPRLAADAVDAEQSVADRSDDRSEPDQGCPPDRRTHVRLGQHDVRGHDKGQQHVGAADKQRDGPRLHLR